MPKNEAPPKRRRRWKRTAIIAGVLAIVSIVTLLLVANPNRYRAQIEELLARRTGLDISLGEIRWALLPRTMVTVDSATVSGEGWHAEIEEVRVTGSLLALLSKQIRIDGIDADSLSLTLPGAPRDWLQPYRDIAGGIRSRRAQEGGSGFTAASIGPIEIETLSLHSPGYDRPLFEGTLQVSDVVAQDIRIAVKGSSPAGGAESGVTATAGLTRTPGEGLTRVSVEASVTGLDLYGLLPGFPHAILEAQLATSSEDPDNLAVEISGLVADAKHPQLDGTIVARFRYTPEAIRIEDAVYDAQDANLHFSMDRDEPGDTTFTVSRAVVRGGALDAFLEQARRGRYELVAAEHAQVSVSGVVYHLDQDGHGEFSGGDFEFSGLTLRGAEGQVVETGIAARGTARGERIVIDSLTGRHSSLTGYIEPDMDNGALSFQASGRIEVNRSMLPAVLAERYISELAQPLRVENLSGTYLLGEGMNDDLALSVTLEAGTGKLTYNGNSTNIATTGGTLTYAEGSLGLSFSAAAEAFGPVSIFASHRAASGDLEATVQFDVPKAVEFFTSNPGERPVYQSILDSFGRTTVNVTAVLPEADTDPATLRLEHRTEPELDAHVTLIPVEDGGYSIGDIAVTARVEAEVFDQRLTGPLRARGPVDIAFERSLASETFSISVNASPASVRIGRRLEKRPGDPLTLQIGGTSADGQWRVTDIGVACLGEQFDLRVTDGGFVCDETQIDLAKLTRLAPEGGFLRGGLRVAFDGAQGDTRLDFERVGFDLGEGLQLDTLDGVVLLEAGKMGVSRLRLANRAGACTIRCEPEGDRWVAVISGEYLDANILQEILDAVSTSEAADTGAPEPKTDGDDAVFPLEGSVTVQLAKLRYANAEFEDVRVFATTSAKEIHVTEMTAAAYGGQVQGTLRAEMGGERQVAIFLTMDGVDTKLFDDLLFNGEREFHGAASGTLDFRSTSGSLRDMLAAGNGTVSWEAEDGSFGKLGWSTRLLGILKTTEVLALRVPAFRDKGLTYDTCAGTLRMTGGHTAFEDVELKSPAYKMTAQGYLDFAKDDTGIVVKVYPLESINRIAEKIPLIKQAAKITTGLVATSVHITGSPYDPEF